MTGQRTGLSDRRQDQIHLEEVERIRIETELVVREPTPSGGRGSLLTAHRPYSSAQTVTFGTVFFTLQSLMFNSPDKPMSETKNIF